MTTTFTRALFVGLIALLGSPPALARHETERHQGHEVVARSILVKFKGTARAVDVETVKRGADIDRDDHIGGIGVRRLRSRTHDVAALLARFSGRPDVEYAQPDFIMHLTGAPNDPSFSLLWGMQKISAPSAWDVAVGSRGVVLGVVDSGIDYNHPDLAPNLWSAPTSFTVTIGGTTVTCAAGTHGFNVITNSCDPRDDFSHGTHVSGTAAAAGNNAVGVPGVSWTGSIMSIKIADSSGTFAVSDAVNGIEFAIQAKAVLGAGANVRVLSNSWGGLGAFFDAVLRGEINRANDSDMLFVAAAGNQSSNNDVTPFYPANDGAPNVLSVGASDSADRLASFSDYGSSVRIFAPGVDVWSTLPNGGYGYMSGTSMATPHVSGAAALILSRCPFMNTSEVKSLLLQTADTVPGLNAGADGLRLNVDRAVRNCITTFATSTALGASSSQVRTGQAVVLTATVSGRSSSGNVDFYEDGTLIATSALVNGAAGVTTTGLGFGLHQFAASYRGDDHSVPSSGNTSVMAGTLSSVTLGVSSLQVLPGQPVTMTAAVSGDSPTGTVTFLANGVSIASATVGNGVARATTAVLPVGVYRLTASYGGDINNSPSSTATAVVVAVTALNVASSFSASATQFVPFDRALSASGGTLPYTWNLVAGALPSGLTLNAATGAIAGTPLAAGTYSITFSVKDGAGFTASFAGTIAVQAGNPFTIAWRQSNYPTDGQIWRTESDVVYTFVADVNGDHRSDLVQISAGSYQAQVMLSNGNGTFTRAYQQNNFPVDGQIWRNASDVMQTLVGDFNGDGKSDLIQIQTTVYEAQVLLSNGDGSFRMAHRQSNYPVDGQIWRTASDVMQTLVGDFNGDGKADLIQIQATEYAAQVLFSNGDGTFTRAYQQTNYPVDGQIWRSASDLFKTFVADVNGDGKADLIQIQTMDYKAQVLLSNGDGSFTRAYQQTNYPNDGKIWRTASDVIQTYIADVNGDGKADIVQISTNEYKAQVFLSNGDGSFTLAYAQNNYPIDGQIWRSANDVIRTYMADVNGDGKADIVQISTNEYKAKVLLSNGDGSFALAYSQNNYPTDGQIYRSAPDAYATFVGDFNGDRRCDLIQVGNLIYNVQVLGSVIGGSFP